jgi:hypothetical protein
MKFLHRVFPFLLVIALALTVVTTVLRRIRRLEILYRDKLIAIITRSKAVIHWMVVSELGGNAEIRRRNNYGDSPFWAQFQFCWHCKRHNKAIAETST